MVSAAERSTVTATDEPRREETEHETIALSCSESEACMSCTLGHSEPGAEATTMKVRDLIEILEDQDPDAEVLIMSQENWPFENAIAGIAVREEIVENDEDLDDDEREETRYEKGTAPNDVFIVEGRQLRYGSKAAWDAARR